MAARELNDLQVRVVARPAIQPVKKVEKPGKTEKTKYEFNWVDNKFSDKPIELNGDFSKVETPSDFKLGLYPHQEVAVKALSDLEDKRFLLVGNNIVETNACILSEKLGSGKTIEILALICLKPHPVALPETINIPQLTLVYRKNNSYYTYSKIIDKNYISPEITMRFKSMLHPNVIVVGKSVIRQWESAIQTFTHKSHYTISDQHSLVEFYKLYRHGHANHYDIILIKNGTVSNFTMNGENPDEYSKLRSIPDVIAKMCYNTPFARVIYDDFDTINMSGDTIKINALFTIFVSTTWNKYHPAYIESISINKEFKSPIEFISELFVKRRLLDVFYDLNLNKVFNIRNTNDYVKISTNIPIYTTFKCVYVNPNDNFISLMGNLGANELVEMMNGDAIRTAASAIGITASSPFEIFKKLLNNKYTEYMTNKTTWSVLKSFKEYILTLPNITTKVEYKNNVAIHVTDHTNAEVQKIVTHLIKHADDIYKQLKKASVDQVFTVIALTDYHSIALNHAINELELEYSRKYDLSGIEINRMKDNLREQMCVVCKMDTTGDVDILIPRCCSNIIGADCFKITGEVSKCPGCGKNINIKSDVVYIKNDFDMQALLNAEGNEEVTVVEEKMAEGLSSNPKLQALYNIINNEQPKNSKIINRHFNAVIEGMTTVDPPKNKKILLFANYHETLEMIDKFLRGQKMEFLHLGGDYKQIDNTIKQFKESNINVLLINSQQICAGLNLQFATDIVFFHKLNNNSVESQLIGRAQRIGRTSNLKIHFLLYTNEAQLID
jgi:SNF2 family DNA or RNA helicase